MAIVDIPTVPETITDKANRVRAKLRSVIGIADIRLLEIRNIVTTYGQPAIAAELGDDAAALLTVYNALKSAVEAAKEITVEDLPNG